MQKSQTQFAIGLDIGTSSIKGVLLSSQGEIAAKYSQKVTYKNAALSDDSPYLGIDVLQLYRAVCTVIKTLNDSIVDTHSVCGVCIVSASGNTLLCDEKGSPLIDAYSWQNPPMQAEVQAVFGDLNRDEVARIAGWQFNNTFPIAHLAHIKTHAPTLLQKASHICMTTEYILYKLTGKWVTDRSTATPFYLADQLSGKWHLPYLNTLGISDKKLPKLQSSGDCVGGLTHSAMQKTGLSADTQVFLGCFDHPGAARASAITEPGQLLISCGTSWVCFFPHMDRDLILSKKLLCDPFLHPQQGWGAMFSLSQVGKFIDAAIREYVSDGDNMFEDFQNLAQSAHSGAGGLKINPMQGIPSNIKNFSKQNIARAIMEGTAELLKSKLNSLSADGIEFSSAVMAGGPSKSPAWRQVLSSILQIPIQIKYGEYSGAAGAAKFCFAQKP